MPKSIVDLIIRSSAGPMLDYLVLNRVFRFQVKSQYIYVCDKCGFSKKTIRIYEDYSSCEQCGSVRISTSSNWRMGKDKIVPFSTQEQYIPKIINQMLLVYSQYFQQKPSNDFLTSKWHIDTSALSIPKPGEEVGALDDMAITYMFKPKLSVQFLGGEPVTIYGFNNGQALAFVKAAILCPYLWDDLFDWKRSVRKDQGQETHLMPLLHLISRFIEEKKNKPRRKLIQKQEIHEFIHMPQDQNQNQENQLPSAIALALNNDLHILDVFLH